MNKALLTLVALTITVSANVNINAQRGTLPLCEVEEVTHKDRYGIERKEYRAKQTTRAPLPFDDTVPGVTKATQLAAQKELNQKAVAVAATLTAQAKAEHDQAVAQLPLSSRVVRFFYAGDKVVATEPAVSVAHIRSQESADALSTRTLSTRAPKLKTEIVNTNAAAQNAAITQAIPATQQAMADAKVTTAKKTPTTNPSRFMTILKNHKGKIAAGTIAAVALALGAYYGIPAFQAYQAMKAYKAYEATYWGKFATTVAIEPFVPSDPRRIINAFMLR